MLIYSNYNIAKGKRQTIVDKTLHRILKMDSATRIPLNTGGQLSVREGKW
jgi:hypothetical protein